MVIFELKWKATLSMLNNCVYFLGNFWKKFGLLFNLTSGHSGSDAVGAQCDQMMEWEVAQIFPILPKK